MTLEEYKIKKNERKAIWLERATANTMGADEELVRKEAEEKFDREYPPFASENDSTLV